MTMDDIYIPTEIWEYILLYLPMPSARRTCKLFHEIEMRINDYRLSLCLDKYEYVFDAVRERDWYSMRIMMYKIPFYYEYDSDSNHDPICSIAYTAITDRNDYMVEFLCKKHQYGKEYISAHPDDEDLVIEQYKDYIIRYNHPNIENDLMDIDENLDIE